MPSINQFYQQLVTQGFFIFEEKEPYFQEHFLQVLWNEQWLATELRTEKGQILKVLHPGIWNVAAGPDFNDARVIIDHKTRSGCIEIHFRPEDWRKHRHHINQDYDQVILHVVWHNPDALTECPTGVPIFNLSTHLRGKVKDMINKIDFVSYPYAQKVKPGQYSTWINSLNNDQISDIMQSSGIMRILAKGEQLALEITALGLEEAGYRRFLAGMGYKHNQDGFSELAEQIPLTDLSTHNATTALALMLGSAGLLPDPSRCQILPEYHRWLHELWDAWWPIRTHYHQISWRRHQLRPFNSPERRIIAAHFVLRKNNYELAKNILRIMDTWETPEVGLGLLKEIFMPDYDHQLDRFLHFQKQLSKPIILLGKDRINDLIVNFAIPLFFAYSFLEKSPEHCARGKKLLQRIPKLQDNRRFKVAAHRLFIPPGRGKEVINNACAQQGLLYLYQRCGEIK